MCSLLKQPRALAHTHKWKPQILCWMAMCPVLLYLAILYCTQYPSTHGCFWLTTPIHNPWHAWGSPPNNNTTFMENKMNKNKNPIDWIALHGYVVGPLITTLCTPDEGATSTNASFKQYYCRALYHWSRPSSQVREVWVVYIMEIVRQYYCVYWYET